MTVNLEKIFNKIGLVFDSEIGIYSHKKMKIPLTVCYDEKTNELVLLDQTKLPYEIKTWRTNDWKKAGNPGIKGMIVRGSQAIGCATGYSVLLAAIAFRNAGKDFMKNMEEATAFLRSTRPTAYPLIWAINLTMNAARKAAENSKNIDIVIDAIKDAADYVLASDLVMSWFLRQEGMKHIEDGDVIMTHCNGGSLSSSFGGHALGMIEEAYAEGTDLMVISKETRPRSQGYKLTVWELNRAGVPIVIVTDNMITSSFKHFQVSKIILGVDRVAKDGSVANKIGSLDIAQIAYPYGIPFYYATSYSTIDLMTEKGEQIPIEERKTEEITYYYNLEAEDLRKRGIISGKSLKKWPPEQVISREKRPTKGKVLIYNPAFDVTPPKLINLIITDIGAFRPSQIKLLTEAKIDRMVQSNMAKWGIKSPIIT
ncbi:MAG TPA: s-methyl-5-thioribose-1-phosphate isomerase [archaeon]|nr:s-methyl-5-thioribose-1-phosphate isomerase [archaeon]